MSFISQYRECILSLVNKLKNKTVICTPSKQSALNRENYFIII